LSINAMSAVSDIGNKGVKVLKNGELKTEPTLRKSKVRL
jgi:hypothetical protein